ncbi:replication protein RepA [Oscillatoria sp. CS-180]|uniref:replication protein RepA n=1 Tax=Oscillatoria sp. CS-180 TaxID=3021720 RepID=UPI00232CFEC1|nr:replication protein RepA [Oscillatoria sp. CS-180]MDB9526965.1 replication protein RepA [Oscillatoria sp. CS-180]
MPKKHLSHVQHRLLDLAVQVKEHGYEPEKAFVSREMVQATLPHKNPGDIPAWSRRNGNYALTMQPGWDTWEKRSYGYPYGTIPRLLIFWLTTEALRTGDRRLELGNYLADFMRKLGLDPSRGGKRGDAKRLRDQMERLFRARISFEYRDDKQQSWLDMQIAPKAMTWWSDNLAEQRTLWESYIVPYVQAKCLTELYAYHDTRLKTITAIDIERNDAKASWSRLLNIITSRDITKASTITRQTSP